MGGRGEESPVTTFRVFPPQTIKNYVHSKKKKITKHLCVSCFLMQKQKTKQKLQPAVVAHVKILSQNAGNGTKSWLSVRRKRKERKGRREKGGKKEGRGGG